MSFSYLSPTSGDFLNGRQVWEYVIPEPVAGIFVLYGAQTQVVWDVDNPTSGGFFPAWANGSTMVALGGGQFQLVLSVMAGAVPANWNGQIAYLPTSMSGGGAPSGASYVTLGTDPTLTNERVLTAGTNISIVDSGPGLPVTINNTAPAGAPATAQYLTLATDGTLPNERVLTEGPGVAFTDGGPGAALSLSSITKTVDENGTARTISGADVGMMIITRSSSPTTITVPANVIPAGKRVWIWAWGTGKVSVVAGAGIAVFAPSDRVAKSRERYAIIEIYSQYGGAAVLDGGLEPITPYASSYNIVQTIPTGTAYVTLLPGTKHADPTNALSAAGVFTAPISGAYFVNATLRMWGAPGGAGAVALVGGVSLQHGFWSADNTGTYTCSAAFLFSCAAGATLQVQARQDSGVNRDVTGLISIARIG